ncbi:hypothetical protein LINPERPRIM_LOCUS39751, partial [Linum perenne]
MTAAATSTSCLEITGFKNRKDPFNSRKRKKSCVEESIFKKRQKQTNKIKNDALRAK